MVRRSSHTCASFLTNRKILLFNSQDFFLTTALLVKMNDLEIFQKIIALRIEKMIALETRIGTFTPYGLTSPPSSPAFLDHLTNSVSFGFLMT